MTDVKLEEVLHLFMAKARCAGLDLGTKTIGLAVSDKLGYYAHSYPYIKRQKFTLDSQKLLDFFAKEEIQFVIIGLPLNMNGSMGPRAQATKSFVSQMRKVTPLPFIYWDERLSTIAAQKQLANFAISREKRQEKIDSLAAAFILQGALARLNQLKEQALSAQKP